MKNEVNELDAKKMYNVFTQAEKHYPNIYIEICNLIDEGKLLDVVQLGDNNFTEYVFSSNQFTWVMKVESLVMKDFFKFDNKDLII